MKNEENYFQNINDQLFTSSLYAFSNLVSINERYYFTSHIKSISFIAKSIGEYLDFESEKLFNMIITSIFFSSILNGFPLKFKLGDPNDFFEIDDKSDYFEVYNNAVNVFLPIDFFKQHARILYQIWEHYDGTGLPNGVSRQELLLESQIIALANNYHNKVYRIKHEDIPRLTNTGIIRQTYQETLLRHENAVLDFKEKSSWYHNWVTLAFFDLIKLESCLALIPVENELTVKYIE
jgi:hypothetical protein